MMKIDNDDEKDFPLPLHELLDRFEILYPDISELSDLRRAVVDRDLSSIFRLCEENQELRRAVVDENWHSVFRVLKEAKLNITNLTDIRKTVVEKNLNSLFRLLEHQDSWHVDDLRRAMLEENLYSLFRLFPEDDETIHLYRTAIVNKNIRSIFKLLGNDDLRKLITNNNTWKLWGLLEQYVDTQFTAAFKNFFVNNKSIDPDCFSRGQLESKLWLVSKLKDLDVELGTVFLCAGWYATLAAMLFESNVNVDKVRSFDIDPTTIDIAEVFNKPWFMEKWKFKALVEDIHNIDYSEHTWQFWSNANNRMSKEITDVPDTIINTSCEHITNFKEWYTKIPKGKLVVLQSNNYYEIDEHVNCVSNVQEFKKMAPMSQLLYSGKLKLPKYTRFMLIGYK